MIRVIDGLPFEITSPSYYRIAPHAVRPGASIDISYVDGGEWLLMVERDGEIATEVHRSRDAAIMVVALAYAE